MKNKIIAHKTTETGKVQKLPPQIQAFVDKLKALGHEPVIEIKKGETTITVHRFTFTDYSVKNIQVHPFFVYEIEHKPKQLRIIDDESDPDIIKKFIKELKLLEPALLHFGRKRHIFARVPLKITISASTEKSYPFQITYCTSGDDFYDKLYKKAEAANGKTKFIRENSEIVHNYKEIKLDRGSIFSHHSPDPCSKAPITQLKESIRVFFQTSDQLLSTMPPNLFSNSAEVTTYHKLMDRLQARVKLLEDEQQKRDEQYKRDSLKANNNKIRNTKAGQGTLW